MIALDQLLNWYATLTPHNVGRVAQFYASNAHFRDPFNDVQGVVAIEAIFTHMFAHTEQPHFIIGERVVQGRQAFVTWVFAFHLRGKLYEIAGVSHLCFDDYGKVVSHRDYWDAAEELLQKLPLIGKPIRWLRGRFKAVL
jgi:hypothetical protein